jgi:hypothetical protein
MVSTTTSLPFALSRTNTPRSNTQNQSLVILSEVGAHATRSRRIPILPIVTMPHQGVLSIPRVPPSLAVRDGFYYNFPTFCLVENQHTEIKHTESEFGHPERSRRACDAQSKDPDPANCDHAASSVLSIPHVPPSLAVRDGFYYNFPTSCLVEN